MYPNETNEFGCPLREQSGRSAIQNFDVILANLPPALRAAFEAERTARQQEYDRYICEHGYTT